MLTAYKKVMHVKQPWACSPQSVATKQARKPNFNLLFYSSL